MILKKRRKSSRFRGSKTHARGFKKKARGSGHRGGFGMAGSGKRGDQKKTLILSLFGNDYFGKDRALRRGTIRPKLKVINLDYLQANLQSLVSQGLAKESSGSYEINLKGYKLLGEGSINFKAKIMASSASQSAIDKITKSGGSLDLESFGKKEESSKKVEKPAVKKAKK